MLSICPTYEYEYVYIDISEKGSFPTREFVCGSHISSEDPHQSRHMLPKPVPQSPKISKTYTQGRAYETLHENPTHRCWVKGVGIRF